MELQHAKTEEDVIAAGGHFPSWEEGYKWGKVDALIKANEEYVTQMQKMRRVLALVLCEDPPVDIDVYDIIDRVLDNCRDELDPEVDEFAQALLRERDS